MVDRASLKVVSLLRVGHLRGEGLDLEDALARSGHRRLRPLALFSHPHLADQRTSLVHRPIPLSPASSGLDLLQVGSG